MARSEQRAAADTTPISDIGPLIEPLVALAERLGRQLRAMPTDIADSVAERAVDVAREAIARGRTPPPRAGDFTLQDFLAPLPEVMFVWPLALHADDAAQIGVGVAYVGEVVV